MNLLIENWFLVNTQVNFAIFSLLFKLKKKNVIQARIKSCVKNDKLANQVRSSIKKSSFDFQEKIKKQIISIERSTQYPRFKVDR